MNTTQKFSDTTGQVRSLESLALRKIERKNLGDLRKHKNISQDIKRKALKELVRRRQRPQRARNAANAIVLYEQSLPSSLDLATKLAPKLASSMIISDEFFEEFDHNMTHRDFLVTVEIGDLSFGESMVFLDKNKYNDVKEKFKTDYKEALDLATKTLDA